MKNTLSLPVLQQLLANIQEAVLFVHQSGAILKANGAALKLLNIEQLSGCKIDHYLTFSKLKNRPSTHVLMEQKNKEGRLIEVKSLQINKETYCLILVHVSLRKQSSQVRNHVQNLLKESSEGLVIYTGEKIVDCDQSFARMFGYSQQEIIGMKMKHFLDPHSMEILYGHSDITEELNLKLQAIDHHDQPFHIQLIQHKYVYDGREICIAIIKDISELVIHQERLEYMAYYDELTDLPNRNFFIKKVKEAISSATKTNEQFAVYFADLDYFKQINETLGYEFGDKLLKACSERLRSFVQTDTFLARIEGDKFLILHRNIQKQAKAIQFVEKIISAFSEAIEIEGYEIYISISIGISIFPQSGKSATDLIRHANSAMYVIKGDHRRHYHLFEESISNRFKMMLTMENDLRKALKNGEFELHYQPQKSLASNKVVGVEALLRWNHPGKGNIPPRDFIPLAEKTGIILEIGDWVLEEACKQNKQWQDQGYDPIVVSVNLSAKQFHQHILVEKVKNVLKKTGLDPAYLELEITESMAMTNEKYILKTMQCLQNLGVVVSIDDFGTGYSSLKYLSLFPINKLKIDKIFMDTNQIQNQAIVKSIINMSHSLNMEVIAEGVETAEQLLFLRKENCDQMQGFYFSKPVPAKQLPKFLIAK